LGADPVKRDFDPHVAHPAWRELDRIGQRGADPSSGIRHLLRRRHSASTQVLDDVSSIQGSRAESAR
jgi:hypothetical protein